MQSEPMLTFASILPLHFGVTFSDSLLVVALGVGAVLSTIVAVLSFVAFYQRRTTSYLLIAVAFSTFLGKTTVGLTYLLGRMNAEMHHSFEHSLDVVMMVLVLAAVYHARSSEGHELGSR